MVGPADAFMTARRPPPIPPAKPDFTLERDALDHPLDLFAASSLRVIGIDEAGRGPWAGPVTAAAAWINPDALDALPPGLNDSKKLSASKRAALFHDLAALPASVFCYAVASRDAAAIDENGILSETFRAMDKAATDLVSIWYRSAEYETAAALHLLVDGNLTPPFPGLGRVIPASIRVTPLIKGDARSLSIAAASIMAKETRDQLMKNLDDAHPGYGWARNMGYGTADHRAGLATQGPTHHHRLSYKPVAAIAAEKGYTR